MITLLLSNLSIKADYKGKEKLVVGNGTKLLISHVGSTALLSYLPSKLQLKNILHVPQITKTLLSISQFTKDNDVLVELYHDCCIIKDKVTKKVLLEAALKYGLYQLDLSKSSSPSKFQDLISTLQESTVFLTECTDLHCSVKSCNLPVPSSNSLSLPSEFVTNRCTSFVNCNIAHCTSDITTWHQKLGLPCTSVLSTVIKYLQIPCKLNDLDFCTACKLGKLHQIHFSSSDSVTTMPFQLVHSDLWGPSPVESVDGFRFYIHFIDDFTTYTWVYPLSTKSQAFKSFML